jgi:membrane-bound ClpP family serine protease
LKSSIDSKVNEGITTSLHVGDEGKTVSTLRPVGKAEFKDGQFEVKTTGEYVETGMRIRITGIHSQQVTVEPIN